MPEAYSQNPFEPGTIFELADQAELHPFEELLASYLSPDMIEAAKSRWDGRTKLRDALRPVRFNGRVSDIQVQVMDNPAERIFDARQRGFRFGRGNASVQQLARFAANAERLNALGLTYVANARSTGRGIVGQVQAELWYQPDIECYGGDSMIQRIVTNPKIEEEKFIKLEEASKLVALDALRRAIKAARPNSFHN